MNYSGLELLGAKGFDPQLSFKPPYSLLFFNYQDFSRALLTLPVIFYEFQHWKYCRF